MSGRTPSIAVRPEGRAGREDAARARLEAIARLLDSRWRVPGTGIRFGADAALNLVPGFGLVAAKAVSAYLIWEARRLGVPPERIVCTGDDASCEHLHQNGAEDTLVRLPENASAYTRKQ